MRARAQDHFRELFCDKCSRCSLAIWQGDGATALGETFHISCIVCSVCESAFGVGSKLYSAAGKLLCEEHWKDTLPKCAGCNTAITGAMLKIGDSKYHKECVKCIACGASGGKTFVRYGFPVCEAHSKGAPCGCDARFAV